MTTDRAPSLFAPTSVTRRLHADPLLPLAGLRAVLLQALDPTTQQWDEMDAWELTARTSAYLAVTTFGSSAEALVAAARRRAEPDTQDRVDAATLWMHCCLVSSVLDIALRSGLYLSPAEQDAYLTEQVTSAVLAGLDPLEVPRTRQQLENYFEGRRADLACTPAAAQLAQSVLRPARRSHLRLVDSDGAASRRARVPDAAAALRAAWAAVAGLAYAALPAWARRLYRMPEASPPSPLTDAATTVGLRGVRSALRLQT